MSIVILLQYFIVTQTRIQFGKAKQKCDRHEYKIYDAYIE